MLICVAVWFIFFFSLLFKKVVDNSAVVMNGKCYSTEEKIVRGDSMSGIVESGTVVKILSGYYECNEVKRGDIVIYNFAGDTNPIIKIVKGISGDKFSFQKNGSGWFIFINGKKVENAQNQAYFLDEKAYNRLSLYEHDYKGVIPKDAYLIFGNVVSGSVDSTHFGLVGKEDILGKVSN